MASTNFRKDITPFLEIIYNGLKGKKRISKEKIWHNVTRVIGLLEISEDSIAYCFNFLFEVCRILDEYKCSDITLKALILDLMMHLTCRSLKAAKRHVRDIYHFANCGVLSKYHLEMRECFTAHSHIPDSDIYDLMWNAAGTANLGLLKLYLKFGAQFMFMLDEVRNRALWYTYLQLLLPNRNLMHEISEEYLFHVFTADMYPLPEKRYFLAMRALDIFFKMKLFSEHVENFRLCYDLVFQSIPEPELTSEEMKIVFQYFLPILTPEDIRLLIENLEILLPSSAQVLQPRSLLHLSRCQVRKSLRESGNLSQGVSNLNIPELLKKYVLLGDDTVYRYIVRTQLQKSELNHYYYNTPNTVIDLEHNDDYIMSVLKKL